MRCFTLRIPQHVVSRNVIQIICLVVGIGIFSILAVDLAPNGILDLPDIWKYDMVDFTVQ